MRYIFFFNLEHWISTNIQIDNVIFIFLWTIEFHENKEHKYRNSKVGGFTILQLRSIKMQVKALGFRA